MTQQPHQKDEILDRLARIGNVAQFVAFRPGASGPAETFSRIRGRNPNDPHASIADAVQDVLANSADHSVNVRSYEPDDPRSREFVYGLRSLDAAIATVGRLHSQGLHLIVNETVDVYDGGVSGVVQGGTIEFAPDDTPRCVEKPGVASFAFADGMSILKTVYGFEPQLTSRDGERTEFSIHPRPRGWRMGHTLLWEHERDAPVTVATEPVWPNRFSRLLGDKAFGLLVADRLGLPVPRTLVIGRRTAPFWFGTPTGSSEVWTRTCPAEPHPGLYTTLKGWMDPFRLLAAEDPTDAVLASLLRQDAVRAEWSGAAIIGAGGEVLIEGARGEGDALMLGERSPEPLPGDIEESVRQAHRLLARRLDAVRFEWVHDGVRTWIVQLHRGATSSGRSVIVPGKPSTWVEFNVASGLDALRRLLDELPAGAGVNLIGGVGLTSHVADVLRRKGAPARIGDV